jgi:mono/diheme cytochrome c family protein
MATRFSGVLLALGLVFTGAAAWTATPAATNQTPAATNQQPGGVVTFHKDVLPIVQKNCQSCHRPGQIGPFSLLSYKEARPWAKAIKTAVLAKQMPPWFADPQYGHFDNDRSLKQAEIDTLVAWAESGAAEGDPKDAPAPIEWAAGGWQIKPDVTFELPPHPVPARGVMEWECIVLPGPFKEDTWVTSVEIQPSAPETVHHLCFGFQKTGGNRQNVYEWEDIPRDEEGVEKRGGDKEEKFIFTREVGSTEVKRSPGGFTIKESSQKLCYLPGLPYEDYRPANAGVFVPAGSEITVNIHYTTNGLAVVDRTRVGLTVAKVPPARKFVARGGEADAARGQSNNTLAIPPYERDYAGPIQVTAFLKDIELVWFRAHAHIRGKSVQFTLEYPDGRKEIALSVPRFDFNWQLTYRTSLQIPKGSRMWVQYRYDNSTSNKYNPDPSKWVYYGDQSWEEMGNPWMGFLIPSDADENDYIKAR